MKGTTKIILNQETVEAAIQYYFIKKVFDASQLAVVKKVQPNQAYADGVSRWDYEVTVESPSTEEGPEPIV